MLDRLTRPAVLLSILLVGLLFTVAPHTITTAQSRIPEPTPGSSVTPAQGAVGTTFTFAYDGWGSSEDYIAYWIIGPGTREHFEEGQFDNRFDNEGRTVWTWTAPSGVWSGTWVMYARGLRSTFVVAIPFELTGDAVTMTAIAGVTPEIGPPGTQFRFFTDGWPKGDVIDAWLIPPDARDPAWLGRLYGDPNAEGLTTWRWTAPPDVYGGVWTMHARGYYSRVYVQIPFTIDAPLPIPAVAYAAPDTVQPGETVSFYASGLRPNEEVAFWVNAPDTNTPIAAGDIAALFADQQGVAQWTWRVPSDARTGVWQMTAQGRSSFVLHQIPFTVAGDGTPIRRDYLSISPPEGLGGTRFEVTLSGFAPFEQVQYWFSDPTGAPLREGEVTTRTNASGIAVWYWDSPAYAMPGEWTITAIGTRQRLMVQGKLTITGTTGAAPGASVTPDVAPIGTTLSFAADGFGRYEPLSWWLTAPDRSIVPGMVEQPASATGVYTWTWTIPLDAQAGTWQMILLGSASRREYRIPFTVLAGEPTPPSPTPNPAPTPKPAPPSRPSDTPSGTVAPEVGAAGDTFNFRVEGYRPRTIMTYWITAPNRRVYPAEATIVVDKHGILTWAWTAPADAASGVWQVAVKPASTRDNEGTLYLEFTVQ